MATSFSSESEISSGVLLWLRVERVLGGVRNETARWTAFAIWLGVEWPAFTARWDLDGVATLASDSQGFKRDGQKINTRRERETPSSRVRTPCA